RNERLYLMRAVLYASNISAPEGAAEIEALYNSRISEKADQDGNISYYEVTGTGYVFPAFGPGLWGEIEAVVGFDENLARITGVDFIKQNETPGLGARISEEWFRSQFRGKTGPFTRVPEGTETTSDVEFDAITGATITSTAVENILNDTIEAVPGILGRK
ncbi:MAG: FMN-binding protein, partial [Spirochaetales bacterium]|nr:FMN-binding protein [Spirochaetales bacterium]